ncbi:hypothetical protein HJC23_007888 [Cyclotella cryptica]|uniref:Uncharacterized protein n=1 Tax=Cyclotella cryptica TaxID=29204 RepID=A0ABD3R182_9STRA|eukprot:CCRYP_000243-RA/>CCRYP_000243-RA protein AED:0.08 eAED:0.08 QI:0/-1/0/1/-1/1/1/0/976
MPPNSANASVAPTRLDTFNDEPSLHRPPVASASADTRRDRCSESAIHNEDLRNRKRRELCNLLERFYFSDDGTAGLMVDDEADSLSLSSNGFASIEHPHLPPPQDDPTTCALHPRVRRRNNRCPLCAAESTRDLKRRNSTGSGDSLGGLSRSDSQDASSAGANSMEGDRRPRNFSCSLAARGGDLGALAHSSLSPRDDESNEQLDYSMDQLLDPKWADALRQISARLSSRRSSNSLGDAAQDEREFGPEGVLRSSRSVTSMDEAILSQEDTLHPLPTFSNHCRLPPQSKSNRIHHGASYYGSLTQLRQVVEMATRSVGRFTPADDCEDFFLFNGDQDPDEENDDDRSISSMARSDRRNFAESKGRIFPVNQHRRQEKKNRRWSSGGKLMTDDALMPPGNRVESGFASVPLPQEAETPSHASPQYPPTVIHLGADTVSTSLSGSDSSLTLSLSSRESSGGSSSSLVMGAVEDAAVSNAAASNAAVSNAAALVSKEKEHTNSPTSVLDDMAFTQATSSSPRSPCTSSREEEEEEEPIPFGPPFTSVATAASDLKWNSNQEQSHVPKSKKQDTPSFIHLEKIVVEDVDGDSQDDEATVVAEDITTPPQARAKIIESSNHLQAASRAPHAAASRPSRMESSFITALVHNARARSRSRSRARSRSKSRRRKSTNSLSRSLNESTNSTSTVVAAAEAAAVYESVYDHLLQDDFSSDPIEAELGQEKNEQSYLDEEMEQGDYWHEVDDELVIPAREDQEPSSTTSTPTHNEELSPPRPVHHVPPPPPGIRGPIVHPQYKLGDVAREEDMIVFPSSKSHKNRRSRRSRRRHESDDDASDEEDHNHRSSSAKELIVQAIGQLSHLDAAFVRRSDGSWTYALVADGNENEIRFVVNDRGSTKSFPKSLWGSSVRRIRVLTQRQGDRFVYKDGTTNPGARRKRSIARGRSRSKGKGRLVSPSPTRRNNNVLNIPATIMEEARPRSKR